MFEQMGQVHKLTDLNQVDHCLESGLLHLSSSRPGLLRAWFLGKRQPFAQMNGCMEGGILTEHPLSQETDHFFLPRSTG